LNKTRRLQNFLLFFLGVAACLPYAGAETIVDVSQQWKEHVSSALLHIDQSTGTALVPAAPAPIPNHCECESLSTSEKLEQCTYAFTGMVSEAGKPKNGKRTIVFDVDEIFKGSLQQEMSVTEEVSGTDCDLPFEIGQTYLVYARWEWGTVTTLRCMGTKLIEKINSQALGPSEAMKDKFYDHLRDACMGRIDTACCLASLKAMRENYHLPAPEDGCPSETVPDRLRCAGSYTWCISLTEKNHGPKEH
jgi:hypothetical protein